MDSFYRTNYLSLLFMLVFVILMNFPAALLTWLDPHEPKSLAFPVICHKASPCKSFLIQLICREPMQEPLHNTQGEYVFSHAYLHPSQALTKY